MLIRSFREVEAAGRVISISHGKSTAVRVLLKSDRLGFSLSEARCGAGNSSDLWYKNHWEANYVRAGEGTLINRSTGQSWALHPGVLYCVGPSDRHTVINTDDPLRIVSVFNPAIEGEETHDEDGSYSPTGPVPEGKDEMFVKTIDSVTAEGNSFAFADGDVQVVRMLNAGDGMGFSLSRTSVKAGVTQDLWYKNHWEANLLLDGTLEVIDKTTGDHHVLGKGDVYCVGPNDPHQLVSQTDVELLCVFNPPLTGEEVHDDDGAYPASGPLPPGPE